MKQLAGTDAGVKRMSTLLYRWWLLPGYYGNRCIRDAVSTCSFSDAPLLFFPPWLAQTNQTKPIWRVYHFCFFSQELNRIKNADWGGGGRGRSRCLLLPNAEGYLTLGLMWRGYNSEFSNIIFIIYLFFQISMKGGGGGVWRNVVTPLRLLYPNLFLPVIFTTNIYFIYLFVVSKTKKNKKTNMSKELVYVLKKQIELNKMSL